MKIKRRSFVKYLFVLCSYIFLNTLIIKAETKKIKTKNKMKALKKGDTIGLIAPASFITKIHLNKAIEKVKSLGFKPFFYDNILNRDGHFAGTDKERATALNTMFANKKIDAILCVRGGYGSIRMLDLIDYETIKKNPKPLIGYSDVTALLQVIYQRTGLVGFHAPVGIASFNNYSTIIFQKVLMQNSKGLSIEPTLNQFNSDEETNIPYTVSSGEVTGKLVGGNLSVITSLVGTPYELDAKNKIIFLEEISEEPYAIDRMLTQLLLAGILQKAAGIAWGICRKCLAEEPEKSFKLKTVLFERLGNLNIPIAYGLPFGHVAENASLPYGILAKLDADKPNLTFLESAVLVD